MESAVVVEEQVTNVDPEIEESKNDSVQKRIAEKLKNLTDIFGNISKYGSVDAPPEENVTSDEEIDEVSVDDEIDEIKQPFTYIQTGYPIIDRIINDPIIRKASPDIKVEDISFDGNIILINIRRKESSEIYRVDVGYDDRIYIQAPLNAPYVNFVDKMKYHYVAVPLDSEEGKKIITEENYKYNVANINESNMDDIILRIDQTSP